MTDEEENNLVSEISPETENNLNLDDEENRVVLNNDSLTWMDRVKSKLRKQGY